MAHVENQAGGRISRLHRQTKWGPGFQLGPRSQPLGLSLAVTSSRKPSLILQD